MTGEELLQWLGTRKMPMLYMDPGGIIKARCVEVIDGQAETLCQPGRDFLDALRKLHERVEAGIACGRVS